MGTEGGRHPLSTKREVYHWAEEGYTQLFATPWTVAHQALCPWDSLGKNTGGGLPWPPPEDLPNPGTKPASLASHELQVDSLQLSHLRSPNTRSPATANRRYISQEYRGHKKIKMVTVIKVMVVIIS